MYYMYANFFFCFPKCIGAISEQDPPKTGRRVAYQRWKKEWMEEVHVLPESFRSLLLQDRQVTSQQGHQQTGGVERR